MLLWLLKVLEDVANFLIPLEVEMLEGTFTQEELQLAALSMAKGKTLALMSHFGLGFVRISLL